MAGRTTTPRVGAAALIMLGLLAWLWLLEVADTLTGHRLDNLGIHAQDIDGLPGIVSAPFLHAGWDHLISNSVPFFVLGFLVLLGGIARWLLASLIAIVVSGLAGLATVALERWSSLAPAGSSSAGSPTFWLVACGPARWARWSLPCWCCWSTAG